MTNEKNREKLGKIEKNDIPIVPIVMQTFNRLEYTMNVISSFKNNILYPYYLIVVDNGSTDGTVEYLKLMEKLGFVHHLILNNENKGIAEPKNQGIEVVHELISNGANIKYVCITDNDIVPPFIRDNGCVLENIVKVMDKNSWIGMCGVDLTPDNSPDFQEWWWRLRQHQMQEPVFAEIAIGFWFSVTRIEYLREFKFTGESLYGRVDESYRNWLTNVKKVRIGLLKGTSLKGRKGEHIETTPKVGIHLGWTEDRVKYPDYVNMKKLERGKAEVAWEEKGKQW